MNQEIAKAQDEKFCQECGAIIKLKAEICPKCGVRQMAPPSASPTAQTTSDDKSKLVAAMLALFLGGIGIHKFYLGQTKSGVLYLIFCWTLIPAILGFVQGIGLLTMSNKKFAQTYCTA